MKRIAVVYWSGTGNTEIMAQEIAQGARSAGGQVTLFTASEFAPDKVGEFDAFAFGCPAMGSEELEDMDFEPMFSAVESQLSGKEIALFGSYGWGDGEWMRLWQDRCGEKNICVLQGEGLIINYAPDAEGTQKCRQLGAALTA